MTNWTYRIEQVHLGPKDDPSAVAARFDELGAEGWEMVAFVPQTAGSHGLRVETTAYVALFKRPG